MSTEKPTRTRSFGDRPIPVRVEKVGQEGARERASEEGGRTRHVPAPAPDEGDEELSLVRRGQLGLVAVRLAIDDEGELEGLCAVEALGQLTLERHGFERASARRTCMRPETRRCRVGVESV